MLKVAAVLAFPAALVASVASTRFMVVDVREGGPDGHRIVLPVPLFLAQTAVSFAPTDKTLIDVPELDEHLPAALKMIDALREAADGELVRVEEGDELVAVSKRDDMLEVRIRGGHETVDVSVPLRVVSDILRDAQDGEIHAADVIAALSSASRTNLVEVHDGDEHVRVWIW